VLALQQEGESMGRKATQEIKIVISLRELIISVVAAFLFGIVIAAVPQFIGAILLVTLVAGALLLVHQERI
jgi:hypothetical protein